MKKQHNLIECAKERGASLAIDALRPSVHPIDFYNENILFRINARMAS